MVNNQELFSNYESSEKNIKSKNGTVNSNLRFNYVNENPLFFEKLYENYKLSDEKTSQLKKLAKLSAEAIYENDELCNKILSWEKQDENEKFKTLQDLTKFLTIDSGISDFKAYVGDNVPKIKFKSTEKGVGGFFSESDKSITINQSLIKDNLSYNQAMNTFFHEYWHFNQECIQSGNDTDTNITKFNNDYYYSYRPNLGRSNYNAYKNQPIEQEAWFFGKQIENNLVSNIKNLVNENFINGSQNMTGHTLKSFARTAFNLKEKGFELEIDTTNKNRDENGKADRTINLKYKNSTRQAQTNIKQTDLDAFFGEKVALVYFDRIQFNFNNKNYDEIYKNINDGFKNMKQQQEERDYFEMSLTSIIKDKGIEPKSSFNSSSTTLSFKNKGKDIDKLLSSLETNIKLIRPENNKETLRINLPNALVSDLKKNKGFTPYDKMRENLEHGYLISELGKIASLTNNSLKPANDNDFNPKYCDYGVKSRIYEIDCKNGFDFTNELKKQGFDIKYDKNDDFKAYLTIPTELNFDKTLKAKNEVKNNISAKLDKEFLSTPIISNKFSNAYNNIKQEIEPKPNKNNTAMPLNFNKNITR